jgi:hemerythrin-like domain-containing protein
MSSPGVTELLRRRHRSLEARIAALEVDPRFRRARVVQLAEELVAHATVEQLVLYPYAEQLLGVRELSLEIERALDALLGVVGGIDDDAEFAVAIARLSAVFERHVDGDEVGLLPMIETLGDPDQLSRMGCTVEEFERALATSRNAGPNFWPETAGDVVARGGGRN